MSISLRDADELEAAGFLEYEIEMLAEARTPSGTDQPPVDLSHPAWQATMDSRRAWIEVRREQGWREADIQKAIMTYYQRDPRRTPFDFLKAEYKVADKPRPPRREQYLKQLAARKRRRIARATGKYYDPRYQYRPTADYY